MLGSMSYIYIYIYQRICKVDSYPCCQGRTYLLCSVPLTWKGDRRDRNNQELSVFEEIEDMITWI